jgi:hypothetical protein
MIAPVAPTFLRYNRHRCIKECFIVVGETFPSITMNYVNERYIKEE